MRWKPDSFVSKIRIEKSVFVDFLYLELKNEYYFEHSAAAFLFFHKWNLKAVAKKFKKYFNICFNLKYFNL